MILPNAEFINVERDKIAEYLLNSEHRTGATKSQFFQSFGFCEREWKVLADALAKHGKDCEIVQMVETGFGPRYIVEGPLSCPDGRSPLVRTVWQVESGELAPRLITAYPVKQ